MASPSKRLALLIALALVIGAAAWAALRIGDEPSPAELLGERRQPFASNDPVERGCAMSEEILARIWRGHHDRSEDVTMVPRAPNFIGTPNIVSHSGPWDYLQRVPLVFYGPGYIEPRGSIRRPVTLADVYPTVGRLTGVDLEQRDGDVLSDALVPNTGEPPKLIMTIVWDGAGRNLLDRWPGRWPTLQRLATEGTSYDDATVGSSPSITASVHTTLGTGAFPSTHGVIGNDLRLQDGGLVKSFKGWSADDVEVSMFGDDVDAAADDRSLVGLIGWKNWHIGMESHGAMYPGADKDHLGIMYWTGNGVGLKRNDADYETPDYLLEASDVVALSEQLDRADGENDDHWLRQHLYRKGFAVYGNPAWARYETDVILELWEREGYGQDDVPDLFFTNFKMTDLTAHLWTIDSREVAGAVQAQDDALAELIRYLDREVKDYVVIMTADHGHTRSPAVTGAWPINQTELKADVDREFDVPEGETLTQASAAVGLFLDPALKESLDVSDQDVARFLNAYTIEQNSRTPRLPEGYEGRADEQVFSAAIPKRALENVMECKFGEPRAPEDVSA